MIVSSAVRILRACSKVAAITGLQGASLSFRFLFHFVLFVVYHLQFHGVVKWFAKFRTGKFRPRIAFTICTN